MYLSEDEIEFYTNEYIKQKLVDNTINKLTFEIDINNLDNLFLDAVHFSLGKLNISTNELQSALKVSYIRASRIIDQLESAGVIQVDNKFNKKVLINNIDEYNFIIKLKTNISKIDYFNSNILPNKETEINQLFINHFNSITEEKESLLKNEIREEILNELEHKNEKIKRDKLRQEILKELQEEGLVFNSNSTKRNPIPDDVKDKVWNRDGGKCVNCGSNINLEFDHIIPHSKGGANTYRNLQLLCETCNRTKSNKIG